MTTVLNPGDDLTEVMILFAAIVGGIWIWSNSKGVPTPPAPTLTWGPGISSATFNQATGGNVGDFGNPQGLPGQTVPGGLLLY